MVSWATKFLLKNGQNLDWRLIWYTLVASKVYILEEISREDWFFEKKFQDFNNKCSAKTFTCLSKSYGANQSTIQFKQRIELLPHLWYRSLFNFISIDNCHVSIIALYSIDRLLQTFNYLQIFTKNFIFYQQKKLFYWYFKNHYGR